MSKKPVLTAAEAAALVKDGDTVASSGFVGSGMPESLLRALGERYQAEQHPRDLTLIYTAAPGNRDGSGSEHLAQEGLLRRVIAGHWNMTPQLGKMVVENKIEGYNLPLGILSQLFRDIAAHRVGNLTHVGLGTFVDPRLEGGKLNAISTLDLVELLEIGGEEKLLYKALPIQIGLIRGTYADEEGNVTMEREVASLEVTSVAQAVHNSGGKVVVQVERVVKAGSLDPKLVKIPGICVDALVVAEGPEEHTQCAGCAYDGSMSGEFQVPLDSLEPAEMSVKKIIARRAAMELRPGTVVNLGIGTPEYISSVANEEGIGDYMTLTVEAGPVGGVPQGGSKFGASVNPQAILDQPYQFDFYSGGGVDLAFLGLAQADGSGSVNVSRFGPRIAGCGGFIDITQNAKQVFFCGTFTAGGLKTHVEDGRLVIDQEGRERKFRKAVEQITFSGDYARKSGQPVMFLTERAVFELRPEGLTLTEVAPGVDLQTQVLDQMEFQPRMEGAPRTMDGRIFREEPMGLRSGT